LLVPPVLIHLYWDSFSGPLVDAQGRLAGINTFILSQSGGSEGIDFAIPANGVKRVYAELARQDTYTMDTSGFSPFPSRLLWLPDCSCRGTGA
jgi:hypothetical protein